ncbi:MAG TPA: NAD(P)/FAD-dependent oxidoreductase [Nocardioidaceae bacterium]|nr:NAD(P)/FAD-dependent oxidoreductase [Nocardioidaceae bacterium]
MTEHVDVAIVGAGLSGIGAAAHLSERSPGTSYLILEARDTIGGTWDLFRYPGVRSDSDMFTLGYRFRPWTGEKAIADGASVLRYVRETAREHGVDKRIRFGLRVVRASWCSTDSVWHVDAVRADTGETVRFTCGFLWTCSGYYRYDEAYTPDLPGGQAFAGRIVHPQQWPEDLDYAGKRVVVVGSGATAVTLVPAMARDAAHVTMLQRSPTYIISLPEVDQFASALRAKLPPRAAYAVTRWKNILIATGVYQLSRRRPDLMRSLIRKGVVAQLPPGYDVDTHFKPAYNPWDQRLCLVPDGDLFRAISGGTVDLVTDRIEEFTAHGIRLTSGDELEADVVVTATGLNLLAFGGIAIVVDGVEVQLPDTMTYKAMMLSGVPNFAYVVGYTNASWTLKADLVSEYVCRLLSHMADHGYDVCVPEKDPTVEEEPFLDFAAGYVQRSVQDFPKQGSRPPWKLRMNYLRDMVALRLGAVDDGVIRFRQ